MLMSPLPPSSEPTSALSWHVMANEIRPRRPETPSTDDSAQPSPEEAPISASTPAPMPSKSAMGKLDTSTGGVARSPQQGRHCPRLEPTPDPSPDPSPSPSPVANVHSPVPRRFHPNMVGISSSSSSSLALASQEGPKMWGSNTNSCAGTAPHLWMPKPKSGGDGWLSRCTSEENLVKEGMMAAFPNSAPRHGGVSHFFVGDATPLPSPGMTPRECTPTLIRSVHVKQKHWHRRQSSHQSTDWLYVPKETEEEQQQDNAEDIITQEHDNYDEDDDHLLSDSELDGMELDLPGDALWITTKKRTLTRESAHAAEKSHAHVADSHMPPLPENEPLTMPRPAAAAAHTPARRPRPRHPIDWEEHHAHLAGVDIVFPRCESPPTCHLEPDQLFSKVCELEKRRDTTGKCGLWGGYCIGADKESAMKPPKMLSTPHPQVAPVMDPFSAAFGKRAASTDSQSDFETRPLLRRATPPVSSCNGVSPPPLPCVEKALMTPHRETSLVEQAAARRAVQKMEQEALEAKVHQEFTDAFVTQVYNYLSLGFPAMARSFDKELSKITGVSVAELRRDDEHLMADGHFVDEIEDMDVEPSSCDGLAKGKNPEERERCPRWRALKLYVYEWARQHPNLDCLDPLPWGLQERKGSWAV